MLYQILTVTAFILLQTKCIFCHLKNLGEITSWSSVFELENRIVGGSRTSLEQYPFNVQFFNRGGQCGGSIITSKTVLTAAHCFDVNVNLSEMRVFSNARYAFDHSANSHEVWDFKKHDKYNEDILFSNDIAIIIIHDNFKFGRSVQKAMLSLSDIWMNENETYFIATGWGETKYGGKKTQEGLLSAHLRYISRENCTSVTRVPLSPDMFCLFGDGERDTCRGDSGGGVVWNGMIVGIVSHGIKCATDFPSMYTHVNYFKTWIQSTVTLLKSRFCYFHKNVQYKHTHG